MDEEKRISGTEEKVKETEPESAEKQDTAEAEAAKNERTDEPEAEEAAKTPEEVPPADDKTEAARDEAEKKPPRSFKGTRLAVLIFVIFSALAAVCCILLYMSTLPRAELAEQAGYYELREAVKDNSAINAEDLGLDMALTLRSSGWCILDLDGLEHRGRWSMEEGEFSVRCIRLELSGSADKRGLILEDVLGKGFDMIMEKMG